MVSASARPINGNGVGGFVVFVAKGLNLSMVNASFLGRNMLGKLAG
jgi:hypothetical protein